MKRTRFPAARTCSAVQLAIRCHPRVPISPDELEGWLELEVKDLRAQAPHATVRLSRLRQGRAEAHLDIGWLIELELDPTEPLLAGDRLSQALRDMRLLGLQPTVLTPARKKSAGADANLI